MKHALYVTSILVATVVLGYFGYEYLELKRFADRSNAIDGCLMASRYEYKENDTTSVAVPVNNLYEDCLKSKGIQKK